MDFCGTQPEPFVGTAKLTPSMAAIFNTLPSASADLNVYSLGEVQLELAPLLYVKKMTSEDLHTVDQPIPHYYTTLSLSTSRGVADYIPMRTAF